jgi:dihydroneopterin aldolase
MASRTDQLVHTIDYQRVCEKVKQLALEKSWRLVEAMAGDIIQTVQSNFRIHTVSVEIRKFILPDTAYVAVHFVRRRP